MSSTQYASLDGAKKGGINRWIAISLVLIISAAAAVVTYFVTKNHYSHKTTFNANKPYSPPTKYVADIVFRIPYINTYQTKPFAQPFTATVDQAAGLSRLSYYGGADTYIYNSNANTTSYQIIPIFDKLDCVSVFSDSPSVNPALFPDFTNFTKLSKTEFINGTECDVWQFSNVVPTEGNPKTWIYNKPYEGYSGVYTFYRNHKTGEPVAFKGIGHNVVLGGSHTDEYWLDYVSISEVEAVDSTLWAPPTGMTCSSTQNPLGPTEASHHESRGNVAEELHMMLRTEEGRDIHSKKFEAWKEKHGKTYESDHETAGRSAIYHARQRHINAHNRDTAKSYKLSMNHFSDLTATELRSIRGRKEPLRDSEGKFVWPAMAPESLKANDPTAACGYYNHTGATIPESWDWRTKGLVHPPKDQGTCGSCWSYGTTGAIEGATAKKTGKLVAASQQNIIDCSWYYGNNGCGGGNDYLAYAWILEQNEGKIATAESYGPNINENGFCHYAIKHNLTVNPWTGKSVEPLPTIDACYHVGIQWNTSDHKQYNTTAMNELFNDALYTVGPLSVSIMATEEDFYYYASGIYDNVDCLGYLEDLDHSVLAVGSGVDKDVGRYTIIRNSWSTHWGEGGYVRIAQKGNICGVSSTPTYVTVA